MFNSKITTSGKKNKVLIIDDETDNLYVLKECLEPEGFEVLTALNGRQGIDTAIKNLPDVIICDIMMPGIDGFEVMKYLRKNPQTNTIPFIFLTAKSDIKDIREGMGTGADDYITKPINNKVIIHSVLTRLEKKKLQEKKLDELRSSITFSLPHELQTPLTAIIGFNEILQEEYESLKPNEILNISKQISSAAKRLDELIQRILFVTKLEIISNDKDQVSAIRMSTVPSPRKVIETTANKIAAKYDRSNDMILNIKNEHVRINAYHLGRIIEELVDNAFKFSEKTQFVIVETFISNNRFNISVTDYGLGMNESEIANIGIFMQFNRMLFERKGTGLGLSIVKNLVDIYGGMMQIHSIPSKQTLVEVMLPL